MLKGKALKFGDNISTDHIQAGRYSYLRSSLDELSKHTLEDVDPTFVSRVKDGDFIVAGKNFGLGSSREHAARIIKRVGVSAVLVKSVARIFFRNAINVGLPILVCDTEKIDEGDELEINLAAGSIKDLTNGARLTFNKIPGVMRDILNEGGLVPYIKKYGDFKIRT
ncbi:MAG: 3-isopropylmalate dehydratase small subunit [Dehalococcoidia bacterium]|jgi:3-isopropylmalate/(R)-2-methylmalate dehydratase small subunit|nr:3-isopropylmalate dehydratase small subunit [Dehalococcoidia bacterium]